MKKLSMEELNRLSETEFKTAHKNSFIIILDNVRSLHNVGSAFRTADAFLATKIYLCGITGTPPHREITKTALGATDTVDWEYQKNTTDVVSQLLGQGWKIICIEQADQSISLQNFKPDPEEKYAFVFGNEVFGVSEEVIELAGKCLEIPQYGTKHSLNVSVSIGIISWHFVHCSSI